MAFMECEFDDKGRPTRIMHGGLMRLREYDADGNRIKETFFRDGNISACYEFYRDGKWKTKRRFGEGGTVEYFAEYRYDETGEVHCTEYNPDGTVAD